LLNIFRTQNGANQQEDHVATASPLMWIKALDMIMERLKIEGLDFSTVSAISGSAQQHGSVYWKRGSCEKLKSLNSAKFLHQEFADTFSIRDSPIWLDSSTSQQCDRLNKAVGGPEEMAKLTGSRAYERFTGPQIAKIYETRKDAYLNTERITLVSNFLASIFLGDYAPIDFSDGSGMNLLNIAERRWSQECLDACAPDLKEKLGEYLVPSHTILGKISSYFVERYGFNDNCQIVAFTGDNPASLVGMCLEEYDIAISLGTSDTLILSLKEPKTLINGHIFCNPLIENNFMAVICFKNGSLTRERVRDESAEGSWSIFNELIDSTPRGNFGNIGFFYDVKEIYPTVKGDFRFNKFNERVNRFSKEVEARACIEGQFLRLRLFSPLVGYHVLKGIKIRVTGGASCNQGLLQILADVFSAPVYTKNIANSACLGSALMAKYGKR